MGRSLYFDDERRDIMEDIYFAFKMADRGEWEDASHGFERAAYRLRLLKELVDLVDDGELDPNRVEGLVLAGQGSWPHEWVGPEWWLSENGGNDESR